MSLRRKEIEDAPERIHLFALLRAIERSHPDKPRIGRSAVLGQDIAKLEQRPFLVFPDAALQSVSLPEDGPAHIETAVLGYFGPQGPLPLIQTDEVLRWYRNRDDSFVRFANLFATRFLQLFFRAWAEARPIAHADRPDQDRFADWIGATCGVGTPASQDRDRVPDRLKIGFAGLLGSRVRSATRLGQVICGVLGVEARVEERAGLWLDFEPGDRTRLGRPGAILGRSSHAGARVYTITEKAVIELRTHDLDSYRSFLPGGDRFAQLADLVAFMLGTTVDIDVRLALPASVRPPVRLGRSGQLGWTAWTAPRAPAPGAPDPHVADATFRLLAFGDAA